MVAKKGMISFEEMEGQFESAKTVLRLDAMGAGNKAIDGYRIRENAAILDSAYRRARAANLVDMGTAQRLDALGSGAGVHLARMLEHVYSETLKDAFAPTNALDLFEVDRSVPAGARTHTIRRTRHTGKARFYEGNASRRPTVGLEQREETFNVAPIVTSIKINFFDQLAADFSGVSLRADLEDAARDVMDRFLNDKIWNGAAERKLPGVLTTPWVGKQTASVTYGPGTSPDAILADLHNKANYAVSKSKGLYTPNRMCSSIRLINYLSTTKRSATTEDTILSAFLADNPYITEVVPVHELEGAGPNGEDVALFDRKAKDAFVRVMPRDFTMLPIIENAFELEIPCYAIYGGVISREPLHNLITYIPTSGI